MESIDEYLESGILELYVLGDLSVQERSVLEDKAAQYPLIKKELNEIAYALEQYALENAIEPRASLKQQILDNLLPDK